MNISRIQTSTENELYSAVYTGIQNNSDLGKHIGHIEGIGTSINDENFFGRIRQIIFSSSHVLWSVRNSDEADQAVTWLHSQGFHASKQFYFFYE